MKAHQAIGCRQITFTGVNAQHVGIDELVVDLGYAGGGCMFTGMALDGLIPEIVQRFNAHDELVFALQDMVAWVTEREMDDFWNHLDEQVPLDTLSAEQKEQWWLALDRYESGESKPEVMDVIVMGAANHPYADAWRASELLRKYKPKETRT